MVKMNSTMLSITNSPLYFEYLIGNEIVWLFYNNNSTGENKYNSGLIKVYYLKHVLLIKCFIVALKDVSLSISFGIKSQWIIKKWM